jgi:hypothetical protein
MNLLTISIAVWLLVVTALVVVMIYRSQLVQNETDQLFLSETEPSSIHQENDDIIRRADKLQPVVKGMGGAVALATFLVIGVWLVQELHQSNLL